MGEQLKKQSFMIETQEAAHDGAMLLQLKRIEEEHDHQNEKQKIIIQETKCEINSALQSEKMFSQQLCLNSSGDYVMTKKIQALEDLHNISKEEQQQILDEIEKIKKHSMFQEAKETAEDKASFQELQKIEEEHKRSKREQNRLIIETEALRKIYGDYQEMEDKIFKTEKELYAEHQKDLKSREQLEKIKSFHDEQKNKQKRIMNDIENIQQRVLEEKKMFEESYTEQKKGRTIKQKSPKELLKQPAKGNLIETVESIVNLHNDTVNEQKQLDEKIQFIEKEVLPQDVDENILLSIENIKHEAKKQGRHFEIHDKKIAKLNNVLDALVSDFDVGVEEKVRNLNTDHRKSIQI